MSRYHIQALITSLSAAVVALSVPAQGQERETRGESPSLVMRCETYCSRTKLRTANAQISWVDPSVTVGRERAAGAGPVEQQLETTVFRNGFAEGLSASFPTLEPSPDIRPEAAPAIRQRNLPALERLRIVGATRPRAAGEAANDIMRLSPEQRAASVIVEGLEAGLTYRWRIRFRTNGDWQTSEPVVCAAPICPADMREER